MIKKTLYRSLVQKSAVVVMVTALLSSFGPFSVVVVNAQETTPTIDPKLKERQDEADTRKKEADADKAELELDSTRAEIREKELSNREKEFTQLKNSLDLLKAKTEIKNLTIENNIFAYRAVTCSAKQIADDLYNRFPRPLTLVLYYKSSTDEVLKYAVVMNKLEEISDGISRAQSELRDGGIVEVPVVAFEVLTAATAVLSLFKTDIYFEGATVDVSRDEIVAALSASTSISIIDPIVGVPAEIQSSNLVETIVSVEDEYRSAKVIATEYNKLLAAENAIKSNSDLKKAKEKLITDGNLTDDQKKKLGDEILRHDQNIKVSGEARKRLIAQLKITKPEDRQDREPWLIDLVFYVSQFETLVGRFDGRTAITKKFNEALNPIELLRGEEIYETFYGEFSEEIDPNPDVFWLDAKVASAGGTSKKKSNLIGDLFGKGSRLSFSGGAAVSYRVFSPRGRIVLSGIVTKYLPFTKSTRIDQSSGECNNRSQPGKRPILHSVAFRGDDTMKLIVKYQALSDRNTNSPVLIGYRRAEADDDWSVLPNKLDSTKTEAEIPIAFQDKLVYEIRLSQQGVDGTSSIRKLVVPEPSAPFLTKASFSIDGKHLDLEFEKDSEYTSIPIVLDYREAGDSEWNWTEEFDHDDTSARVEHDWDPGTTVFVRLRHKGMSSHSIIFELKLSK